MDYYSILGVTSQATVEEIKQAFREKALKCHPDLNQKGPEEFLLVKQAYEVLSDSNKRAAYDQQRSYGFPSPYSSKPTSGGFENDEFQDFWDNFSQRFDKERGRANADYAFYKEQAAAWEAEKQEAKEYKVRAKRMRKRVQEAREFRTASILRNFWQTHAGITKQDVLMVSAAMACVAFITYTWKPIINPKNPTNDAVNCENVPNEPRDAPPR